MISQHIKNCSLPRWLPLFKSDTLKTSLIPLSPEFIDYLNADGIQLPMDANGRVPEIYKRLRDTETTSDSDDYEDWNESNQINDPELRELAAKFMNNDIEDDTESTSDDEDEQVISYHFPELDASINRIIEEFDGAVFPKLNWSSPRDASWIATGGSLKCQRPSDIYLLLKASDFIAHDLELGLDYDNEYHLCLRKWYDLHPAMEFRCFIRKNELFGWCQRDYHNFYPFLPPMKDAINDAIVKFFNEKIQCKFFDEENYVLDLYMVRNNTESLDNEEPTIKRVWLIDINSWIDTTDSLLFNWTELEDEMIPATPIGRLIESESHARQFQQCNPKFFTSMLPKEAIALGQLLK